MDLKAKGKVCRNRKVNASRGLDGKKQEDAMDLKIKVRFAGTGR
jgi:hypothetical protein